MWRRWLLIGGIVAVAALLVWSSTLAVDESEYVLITQFGRPKRTIKSAGLAIKWPFQRAMRVDRRLRLLELPGQECSTQDKNKLIVEPLLFWRVADPLAYLKAVGGRAGAVSGDARGGVLALAAEDLLGDVLFSELRAEIGQRKWADLLSADGTVQVAQLSQRVTEHCRRRALDAYGIEVVDARVRRLSFPGGLNKESVFERMRSARYAEAKRIRAEGQKEARRIRAVADTKGARIRAEATARAEGIRGQGDREAAEIYADAYAAEPRFYRILRTLEAYKTFLDEKTTLVLTTNSPLLRLLTEGLGMTTTRPATEPQRSAVALKGESATGQPRDEGAKPGDEGTRGRRDVRRKGRRD